MLLGLAVTRLFVAGEGGGGTPGQHAGLEEGHPAQEAGGGEVSRAGGGCLCWPAAPGPTLMASHPFTFAGSRSGECHVSPLLVGGWVCLGGAQ